MKAPRRRTVLVGGLLAAVTVTTVVVVAALSGNGDRSVEAAPDPIERPRQAPTPLMVSVGTGPVVPWDQPLAVTVSGGRLRKVDITQGVGGEALDGAIGSSGRAWQSTAELMPSTLYTVRLLVDGPGRRVMNQTSQVTTTDPTGWLRPTLSPGEGNIVGIGMPAVVRFNRAVAGPDRAAVVERLSVTTNPPVEGAWRWTGAAELHWRPPAYWQPGTTVGVHADLRNLRLSGGIWGADERSTKFTIGEAHVSVVDVAAHQMTVTANGQPVRVMKISAGRERYPTKGGVHIVLAKSRIEIMDSSTVGIPRNGPGGYYKKVPFAVRISNGGTFIHSASWSVADQGVRNVSHGCINVHPTDAQWYFNFTQRGDVVEVVNTPARPVLWDPGMADWNIPWEHWAESPATPATMAAPSAASG